MEKHNRRNYAYNKLRRRNTFVHNGDYSGNAVVHFPGSKEPVTIPVNDLLQFAIYYFIDKQVLRLESLVWQDVKDNPNQLIGS